MSVRQACALVSTANGSVYVAKVLPEIPTGIDQQRRFDDLVFWCETLLGFFQDGDEMKIICIFPPLIPLLKRETVSTNKANWIRTMFCLWNPDWVNPVRKRLTSEAGDSQQTHQHRSQILADWNQLTAADITYKHTQLQWHKHKKPSASLSDLSFINKHQ